MCSSFGAHLENKLFTGILSGDTPSRVLNAVLVRRPDLDKYDLANLLLVEYDLLDSKILPLIWNWRSVRSVRGIGDEEFDRAVIEHMRIAGYDI
ncbi:hypothetical protein CR920_04305 [Stenotrophomonas indicatrix]|jgi:hypothetical protein|nr:hypothetical protein CR920_04305 [Stenotrophomonas indicatrix]